MALGEQGFTQFDGAPPIGTQNIDYSEANHEDGIPYSDLFSRDPREIETTAGRVNTILHSQLQLALRNGSRDIWGTILNHLVAQGDEVVGWGKRLPYSFGYNASMVKSLIQVIGNVGLGVSPLHGDFSTKLSYYNYMLEILVDNGNKDFIGSLNQAFTASNKAPHIVITNLGRFHAISSGYPLLLLPSLFRPINKHKKVEMLSERTEYLPLY